MLEKGLGETSLRQLAKAANVSDRMLLYYFEDKADVMTCVMETIASTFTEYLNVRFPHNAPRSMAEVFVDITELSRSPDIQPFMSVWLETIAEATRGQEPFRSAATQIGAGFLAWIEAHLPESKDRSAKAALVLTMIEGAAVMNACADERTQESANRLIVSTLKKAV